MVNLDVLNTWAQLSCANWSKDKLAREFYRRKCRDVASEYWTSPEHQALMKRYRNGDHSLNTYPWPYSDKNFANWPESDDEDTYSLITDPSDQIIKHSTSYCAWKIYETTGKWPRKSSKEKLDADRWLQFLAEAGYTRVLKRGKELKMFNHYVGVNPNEGESGLVVWMEFASDPDEHWATVSSYVDKRYKVWAVDTNNYRWVLIK